MPTLMVFTTLIIVPLHPSEFFRKENLDLLFEGYKKLCFLIYFLWPIAIQQPSNDVLHLPTNQGAVPLLLTLQLLLP